MHDKWSDWLLRRRSGGTGEAYRRVLERLAPIRDRVLENAALAPGNTLLDVGTGDGLIGLRALDLVGPSGRVVFTDISPPCIAHVKALAEERGDGRRASFITTPAETLEGVADAVADVVTTRSVLIYVRAKQAAFEAFSRVLRVGGRISLGEPINRDYGALNARPDEFYGYAVPQAAEVVARLRSDPANAEQADDPTTDFTHVALVRYAENAGLRDVHLTLRIDVVAREPRSWETFVEFAPNPNAPTISELFAERLTPQEIRRLESALRPLVENGLGVERQSMAYLTAVKIA